MPLTKQGTGAALVAGPRTHNKGEIMQSVEITRATIAAGRRVTVGETIELTDADAFTLLSMGKAIPVVDAPEPVNREAEAEQKMSKRAALKKKAAPAKAK